MESTRRRVLNTLNSRYIYGRVVSAFLVVFFMTSRYHDEDPSRFPELHPFKLLGLQQANLNELLQPLLHTIIFLVEMAITSRLIAKYNSYYADRPILTIMITNAVLGGIADTVAQSLTAIRSKSKRSFTNRGKDISDGIEMPDYDEKHPYSTIDFINTRKNLPPAFDFERLTRFMSYGFLMSPIQFHWFAFLSRAFPITKQSANLPAIQRVCFDQLIFAPMGLAAFFTFMTVTEGGGKRAVARKFQDVYLPALKANFMIWPAAQILNFRVVPLQFQIPFVSTVGIAWTAYLSLSNQSDEPVV